MAVTLKDFFAMAPQLILVVGGLLVLVAQLTFPKNGRVGIANQITILTLILALVVVIFGLSDAKGIVTLLPRAFTGGDSISAFGGTFRYSVFSGSSIVLILSLALGAIFLMRPLLENLRLHFVENYFLILMSAAGYSYALCAEDLMTLFVALELGSIPILALIGMHRNSQASNEAAIKYLLFSAFTMAFFLLGIAILYGATGTMKLRELREISPHFTRTRAMVVGYSFLFVGFFFKLGAVPIHAYLADVFEGATSSFTAFLASFSKAASILIFFKVAMGINDGFRLYLAPILAAAAIASMLYGAFASLGTNNLKRILAYSSIGHAGFMLALLGLTNSVEVGVAPSVKQDAGAALYIYAVGYSVASLVAFMAVGFLELRNGSFESLTLDNLRPLKGEGRALHWMLALAVLSFMGMPPLAGFFGKFFLFKNMAFSSSLGLAAAAGLSSAISVYAYIRVLKPLFLSDEEVEKPTALISLLKPISVRFAFLLSFIVLTFFALAIGVLYQNGVLAVHKIY